MRRRQSDSFHFQKIMDIICRLIISDNLLISFAAVTMMNDEKKRETKTPTLHRWIYKTTFLSNLPDHLPEWQIDRTRNIVFRSKSQLIGARTMNAICEQSMNASSVISELPNAEYRKRKRNVYSFTICPACAASAHSFLWSEIALYSSVYFPFAMNALAHVQRIRILRHKRMRKATNYICCTGKWWNRMKSESTLWCCVFVTQIESTKDNKYSHTHTHKLISMLSGFERDWMGNEFYRNYWCAAGCWARWTVNAETQWIEIRQRRMKWRSKRDERRRRGSWIVM